MAPNAQELVFVQNGLLCCALAPSNRPSQQLHRIRDEAAPASSAPARTERSAKSTYAAFGSASAPVPTPTCLLPDDWDLMQHHAVPWLVHQLSLISAKTFSTLPLHPNIQPSCSCQVLSDVLHVKPKGSLALSTAVLCSMSSGRQAASDQSYDFTAAKRSRPRKSSEFAGSALLEHGSRQHPKPPLRSQVSTKAKSNRNPPTQVVVSRCAGPLEVFVFSFDLSLQSRVASMLACRGRLQFANRRQEEVPRPFAAHRTAGPAPQKCPRCAAFRMAPVNARRPAAFPRAGHHLKGHEIHLCRLASARGTRFVDLARPRFAISLAFSKPSCTTKSAVPRSPFLGFHCSSVAKPAPWEQLSLPLENVSPLQHLQAGAIECRPFPDRN